MLKLSELETQVRELEAALSHEKRVSAIERRRAEAFEGALKRAYETVTAARQFDRKAEDQAG